MKNLALILIVLQLSACSRPPQQNNTSTSLFFEIWELFDQQYAFFELRGIDWNATKTNNLASMAAIQNDSLLFQRFCQLLQKFDDAHINLESEDLGLQCNAGKLPDFYREFPTNEAYSQYLAARDQTLAGIGITDIQESATGLFQYGASPEDTWGYLRIKRFYGGELEAIRIDMDQIMHQLKDLKHLLLDMRVNPGGNDETALLCASYFFPQKEIAFIKRSRHPSGQDQFGPLDTTYVTPHPTLLAQNQSLYLLTNRASGSSADVFALVMSYLPHLTIVGTPTEGIFSDMYRDTLSNGWRVSLSNEQYFSQNMQCYEKVGVPVDIEAVNTLEDVTNGVDHVIELVINSESEKPANRND